MITPAQRAEIRRLYYGEHWKLGTIAAQLGLHRETVRAAVEHESGAGRRGVINDNYFCRSPWWRWAGRGSTRGACDTARFPHGGRVGHGCAGSAIA